MICTYCGGAKKTRHGRCPVCQGTGQTVVCGHCQLQAAQSVVDEHRCMGTVATETADPLATFRELCKRHDTSYEFSDDHGVWQRGSKERKLIRQYATDYLTPTEAMTIWNDVVREKFSSHEGQYPFILTEWRI